MVNAGQRWRIRYKEKIRSIIDIDKMQKGQNHQNINDPPTRTNQPNNSATDRSSALLFAVPPSRRRRTLPPKSKTEQATEHDFFSKVAIDLSVCTSPLVIVRIGTGTVTFSLGRARL